MLQLPVGERRKTASRQLSGMQAREGGTPEKEVPEDTQNRNRKGVFFCPHHPRRLLRGGTPRQRRSAGPSGTPRSNGRSTSSRKTVSRPQRRNKKQVQSVRAAIVNSQPLDNMLRVVSVVQQIMTEFSGALSEEDKIVAITKIVLKLMNQNGH
jgi:hypothetical protein